MVALCFQVGHVLMVQSFSRTSGQTMQGVTVKSLQTPMTGKGALMICQMAPLRLGLRPR